MVVYAEYLFLENTLTGGMILILTGRICGVHSKWFRILIGSMLCGFYSFILFWEQLDALASILIKVGFSAVLIQIVYQPKEMRRLARIVLVFYLVSFAMGGITIGMMYFTGILGVTQNASVYLGLKGYFYLLPGWLASWIGISAFAGLIKGRLTKERVCADVEIDLEGRSAMLKGLVDTGNQLSDPISGMPVLIITQWAARELLPGGIVEAAVLGGRGCIIPEELRNSSYAGRVRMIPFHTVGGDHGCLIGFRTDSVSIMKRSSETDLKTKKGRLSITDPKALKVTKGIILAISGDLKVRDDAGEDCSILLHPNLFEKGIACDG